MRGNAPSGWSVALFELSVCHHWVPCTDTPFPPNKKCAAFVILCEPDYVVNAVLLCTQQQLWKNPQESFT